MKKIFLLIVLLFQLTIVFGQNSDWSEYGSWFSGRCFPQIQTRISVKSNPKINTTSVMVQFKNNYPQQVTFNYNVFNNSAEAIQVFKDKGTLLGGSQSSIGLKPGETRTIVESIKGAGSNRAHIEIYSLYFGNDYQHYQKCVDGSACLFCQVANEPACPNYSKNGNNSSTSKNSNQQNSNSEYEISKADVERQMNEKNAEGQQKSQNYTTAMNAGISAHNSGNYAEAKRQFSIALNNCNTEEARQKAQEYYNKAVEAEKNQATINAIKSSEPLLSNIAKSIDDANEKKKIEKQKNIQELFGANQISNTLLFSNFRDDILNTFIPYGQLNFDGRKKSDEQFEKNRDTRFVMFVYNNLVTTAFWTFVPQFNSMYNSININCNNEETFNKIISEKPYQKFINKESIIKVDKKSRTIKIDRITIPNYNIEYLTESIDANKTENSLASLKASLNSHNKDVNEITQNIISYFSEKNFKVLHQVNKQSNGGGQMTLYYFDENEELFIVKYEKQKEVEVNFMGKYIHFGKDFYKETKYANSNETNTGDIQYTVSFK